LTHNAAEREKNSIAKKREQQISANENFQSLQRIAIGKNTRTEAAHSFRRNSRSEEQETPSGRSNCHAPHRVFRKIKRSSRRQAPTDFTRAESRDNLRATVLE
jgi:hypothetical protein